VADWLTDRLQTEVSGFNHQFASLFDWMEEKGRKRDARVEREGGDGMGMRQTDREGACPPLCIYPWSTFVKGMI